MTMPGARAIVERVKVTMRSLRFDAWRNLSTGFRRWVAAGLFLAISGSAAAQTERPSGLPRVRWNDNERSAGSLIAGILSLELEVVRAEWRYLGEDAPGVGILAFREAGREPENPGPLIRVPLGTEVAVSIRNPLDRPLVVHGLSARRVEAMDSLVVPAGETREARFVADAEGTWYYWGTTTHAPLADRVYEDSQLSGALIVDPPGASVPAREKVMILSVWFAGPDEKDKPDFATEVLTINGRPWPHTERLAYDLGDTVRWRVINATGGGHPMHLHGFFFRVDAEGDNARETLYWPAERRWAATEFLERGETLRMSWVADRPGGWVYHCHISWHVVANAAPGEYRRWQDRDAELLHGHRHGDPHDHVRQAMGGLMMGIEVRAPEGWRPEEGERRKLRLFVQSDSVPGERRRFGFALQEGTREPRPDSVPVPGSTIVVRKGEPTSVTVLNRTAEPTQVHWHGLEIESYYDGVVGVGGHPGRVTPAIMPGDSFTMRITPPRAGSYMYHTHVNDIRQQSAGLYGVFLVLEPDDAWDPEHDRVFLLSTNSDKDLSVLLNGMRTPEPVKLRVGEEYRLRFLNITLHNARLRVRLVRDGYPVRWTAIAKDGADLPPLQMREDLAERTVSVGETYDFRHSPKKPGELHLEIRDGEGELLIDQLVRVVE